MVLPLGGRVGRCQFFYFQEPCNLMIVRLLVFLECCIMEKWILKAVVQKIISYLPYRHRINYLFQKYITKGVYLTDEYFEDRLIHAKSHIESYNKHALSVQGITSLELGTGWYPVVPLSLFLSGANKIYTVDISALCDKEKLLTTIKMFVDYKKSNKLNTFLNILPKRFDILLDIIKKEHEFSVEDVLTKLNIIYLVQDARQLDLEDGLIDLIHSNNTFEHVYPEILESLLIEFKRLISSKGMMSHFIDMSDHFAHFDRTITIYNFLKFSDRQWMLIDNAVQPQNRWRLADYKNLYKKLEINITEILDTRTDIEKIKSIQLHRKYQNFNLEELAFSHCRLVSFHIL